MAINRFNIEVDINAFNIVKSRKRLFNFYYRYLYRYVLKLVKIGNLPESMPEKDIKFIIFNIGYMTVGKADDGKVYGFEGNLGGDPNAYYIPTISTVANPYLKFNKTFELDKDAVLVRCDSMYQGFNDLVTLYAALLTTMDISIYWNSINTRTSNLYEGKNDDVKNAINAVFDSLEIGDKLKAIASKPIFEYMKSYQYSSQEVSTNIKALIELKQYLKASFFMAIGLPSNYNMKRESLNENELDADIYTITPQMDDVIDTLKEDFSKVNKMFGYNITVERDSSLEKVNNDIEQREDEAELDIEVQKKQLESNDDTSNDTSNDTSDNKGGE